MITFKQDQLIKNKLAIEYILNHYDEFIKKALSYLSSEEQQTRYMELYSYDNLIIQYDAIRGLLFSSGETTTNDPSDNNKRHKLHFINKVSELFK